VIWYIALAATAVAFFLSAMATHLAKRVAFRVGMLDIPQRHKAHAQPIPLLGGCAIFASILGPCLLAMALASIWAARGAPAWLPQAFAQYIPGAASKINEALVVLAGALALHVIGIVDDKMNLGPWLKLIAQLAISITVVLMCGIRVLTVLGEPYSAVASVLWLVAITNSFNFLDNMDGLSAGVGAICAASLLAAALSVGQVFVSAWLCLLVGSLAGFLIHNFPPARIFMGDAGSLIIGYLLGVISMMATYVNPASPYHAHAYVVLVPLIVMAVPLYDTFSVMFIRIREGRNPMVGDRRHFSHRLLRRGMSTRTAVLTIWLCTAATAMGATLLPYTSGWIGSCLILAQTFAILAIIAMLEAGESRP
jgi:UDP-GlcNAc:undecaprenyl-phosphate GlcNAc-1-phosphate transferase